MALLFTNNSQSVLASGVSSSATSMAVTSGHGARFPLPSGGNTFRATLVRASDGGVEVVDVTARSTDTMTVVRGQEGTTGIALAAGDKFELRITASYLNANTGDETGARIATLHHAASAKTTLVDADELTGQDSAAGFGLIRVTWANIKATLATWIGGGTIAGSFTTLASSGNTTLGDAEATDTHAVKGATTVLANSASPAMKVTQTGSGNAFVVEDSASTDSTPFVITSDGRTVIGLTAAVRNTALTVAGADSAPNGGFNLRRNSDSSAEPSFIFDKSRGTAAIPTAVLNADMLSDISSYAYDGTNYIQASRIRTEVDGTPGTNDMPGRLVFSTTADGASVPTERMRIDSSGNVGIGQSPVAKLSVRSTGADSASAKDKTALHINANNSAGGQASARITWDYLGDLSVPKGYIEGNTYGADYLAFGIASTECMRIDYSGNVLVINPAGLGYGTGAGGTVTQATSRTTGVTLSKPTGKITLFSTTTTTGTFASFTLTNTLIAATDVVIVNFASATSANKYSLFVTAVDAGSCRIQVYNIAAVAVAEAPVISFCVLKGAVA